MAEDLIERLASDIVSTLWPNLEDAPKASAEIAEKITPVVAQTIASLQAQLAEMRDVLRALWPDNLARVPDHLPNDFVFPMDVTAGELRAVAAALSPKQGEA